MTRTTGTIASCIVGHDREELLLVDLAVLVEVELVDHCLPVGATTTTRGERKVVSASEVGAE